MNQRKANLNDLDEIKALLDSCSMPSEDTNEHLNHFIVFEDEGKIVGVGGLEQHESLGLVRSIAVLPDRRKAGIGSAIYESVENKAKSAGIHTLYLLTETAMDYFSKHGFLVIDRIDIPMSIKNTKQFKTYCPATAIVMFKEIHERMPAENSF